MPSINSLRQSRAASASSFDLYSCASVGAAMQTSQSTNSERSIDHPPMRCLTLALRRQQVARCQCRARPNCCTIQLKTHLEVAAICSESAAESPLEVVPATTRLEVASETVAVCANRVL